MSDDAADTKPETGAEPITVRVRDQVSITISHCVLALLSLCRFHLLSFLCENIGMTIESGKSQ